MPHASQIKRLISSRTRIAVVFLGSLFLNLEVLRLSSLANSSFPALAQAPDLLELKAVAVRLNQQGIRQSQKSDYQNAFASFQQALVIYRKIGALYGEGDVLNNIGFIYSKLGEYIKALEHYQQALANYKKFSNRKGEGITLNNIGFIYFSMGEYTKALEYYQQALAIRKEVDDRSGEGITLNNIGFIYFSVGEYAKALEYYQQALAIRKEVDDRSGEGESLNNIGLVYFSMGEYTKALEYYQQALAIRKEVDDRSGEGESLNNIGGFYDRLGHSFKALEYYQQALVILKDIGDRKGEGMILNNIASLYSKFGQYARALEYYQQALAISKGIGNRNGEGTTLNNIGAFYDRLGQYVKALEYHQQALAISKDIGNRNGEGTTLNNIGFTYLNMGEYAKALEYYQQALAINQDIGNRNGEGLTLNNIGLTYSRLRQYAKALEYYQQALAIIKDIGDRNSEGSLLNNIGGFYDRLGQYAKALEYYQQALAINQDIGDRKGEGIILNNMGVNLLLSNNLSEAEAMLYKAMNVLELLRFGLSDENKVSLLDTQVAPYDWQQKALIAQNKVESALEVAERGRARAFMELLATRINETEKPQLAEALRPTIAQIRQIAKERNSTLVQYSIVDDKTLYVWVVQPSGKVNHRKVDLPQQLSLSKLVNTSREAIGVRGRGNFRIELKTIDPSDRLKQLHQLLIDPIADLLPTDPNAPVIFVPYGELFLVPFSALQDASGKYLIEKHTILTAPAIQVLDLTRQKRQQVRQAGLRDVLIVGNPTMPKLERPGEAPEQLKALDGAEREANEIAALFKTKALTGQQASKAAIMPKLSQARIIHLATHGLLEDLKGLGTPGAIALAPSGTGEPNDGLLTANEILDLKLNAELVVLSACDTGRGKITSDSVIGLSRSLIIAGTPSVIVSLWSVPDAPTTELMTEFYHNWQEKKLDKAQALRQAMLTIMKRSGASPKDWAAFTLIGEAE